MDKPAPKKSRKPHRYEKVWRNKFLTLEATSIRDMVTALRAAAEEIAAMEADGVVLEGDGVADDYAILVTTDARVAEKYGMWLEEE